MGPTHSSSSLTTSNSEIEYPKKSNEQEQIKTIPLEINPKEENPSLGSSNLFDQSFSSLQNEEMRKRVQKESHPEANKRLKVDESDEIEKGKQEKKIEQFPLDDLNRLFPESVPLPIKQQFLQDSSEKNFLILLRESLNTRFAAIEQLDQKTIQGIYMLLFEKMKIDPKEYINEKRHPFSIIYFLNDMVEASESGKKFTEVKNGVNETRFLCGTNNKKLWVFKPVEGEYAGVINKGIEVGTRGKREHVASLLNFYQQFPLPICLYIKLGEEIGSIQYYEEGLSSLKIDLAFRSNVDEDYLEELEEDEKELRTRFPSLTKEKIIEQIDIKQLHSLILFDLLTGNCDRNEGNFIFCLPPVSSLYGIDHGECLSNIRDVEFNMGLMESFDRLKSEKFHQDCLLLIESENLERYKAIIQTHLPESAAGAIYWMAEIVSPCIRSFIANHQLNLTIYDVVVLLTKTRDHLWDHPTALQDNFNEIQQQLDRYKKMYNDENKTKEEILASDPQDSWYSEALQILIEDYIDMHPVEALEEPEEIT